MYSTEMIQDLEKRFPNAKAISLMREREFITTLGLNLEYFAAIHRKLALTAEVYNAQFARDKAAIYGTSVKVENMKTGLRWGLIAACAGGALVLGKIWTSNRNALLSVAPDVASAAVKATPVGALGSVMEAGAPALSAVTEVARLMPNNRQKGEENENQ